jgi:hypothetical protein
MNKMRLLVVVCLAVLPVLGGCLDKYAAEKELWNVYLTHLKAIHEPQAVEAREFDETISALKKVAAKHPKYENSRYVLSTIDKLYAQRDGKYKREVAFNHGK